MARDLELAGYLEERFPNDLNDVVGTRQILHERTVRAISERTAPEHVRWRDDIIAGPDGGELTLRTYRDDTTPAPYGALLFFHGGAFVLGDLESEHDRCVRLAQSTGCLVVSVDYRLAPESPFPAAVEDSMAALAWLREHAKDLEVDPSRIGVGGASAGGALAAVVALRARDEGEPPLRALVLIYPVMDDRAEGSSMTQFERTEPWDGVRTKKMWSLYFADEAARSSRYASPARSDDLAGLPVTYLMVAEEDPLDDCWTRTCRSTFDSSPVPITASIPSRPRPDSVRLPSKISRTS
jgi:acetyl esterase